MLPMPNAIESPTTTKSIIVTKAALHQIRKLIEERELSGYSLRVFISRGGCSGWQYGMGLDNETQEGDFEFNFDDINILIDPVSINYLIGATIDYHNALMGGGFKIDNPNALSSCGCGNSFRTEGSAEGASSASGSCLA
jgi:iron-sulfur cluster assembly accessory protein